MRDHTQYVHKTIYVTKEQYKWLNKKENRNRASAIIRDLLAKKMK